mmetsp:Transcript_11737/g.17748  ORF Transcript_11737/g.17748 Transcript_11737/m.17748 type:complete len:82 (-) Transcript_11737:704-949(-)
MMTGELVGDITGEVVTGAVVIGAAVVGNTTGEAEGDPVGCFEGDTVGFPVGNPVVGDTVTGDTVLGLLVGTPSSIAKSTLA